MKRTAIFRSLVMIVLFIVGGIAANGKELVPFYKTSSTAWTGKFFSAPVSGEGAPDDWYTTDFDDSSWGDVTGPLYLSNSSWQANYYTYWVRCHFTIDELSDTKSYTFFAQHDDGCVAYINGVQIYNNNSVADHTTNMLPAEAEAALVKGDNVLCVRVSDTGGGDAFMDFGLYENDLKDMITHSDVEVTITDDPTYPWYVSGSEVRNSNYTTRYSTSWLTMAYSSSFRTELKFDWYEYNSSQHQPLQLYVDGVLKSSTSNSSWNAARFYIEPGDHVIAFRDSIGNSTSSSNRSGVRNMQIKEILPLETAVLTENSMPLTFENNSELPWTIEDGYIQNGNYGRAKTSSRFSTTFTVEKTSKFSYELAISASSSENNKLNVYINGIFWDYWTAQRDWTKDIIALEPGTYTIEWIDTLANTSSVYYTRIRNIELSNNWIDVELASAGTLGYEVLYTGKADVLTDVEFLKIKGPLNASDWTDIKNMTNLLALDLSEAEITSIPNNAFDGKGRINSVILPEGITSIGEYAFWGTNIRKIHVPSTVTTIGQYAFASTPIQYVTFANNSQLTTISERAFSSCTSLKHVNFGENASLVSIGRGAFAWCYALQEIDMPNTVTDVSYGAFQNCTSMKRIAFSDALTVIRDNVCANCSALEEVRLPVALTAIHTNSFMNTPSLKQIDIPQTLNEIRSDAFYKSGIESIKLPITMQYLYRYAFSNCKSLKYVELPSYLERGVSLGYYDSFYSADGSEYYRDNYRHYGYRYNFADCTALDTIVMRSATPPTIDEDPFANARAKSAITLVVPSFSVVNYKLDTYWYQFGSIVEGDDVDYWKITSPLMLTNNRRMQGTPDVDLYYNGQLTVGGNAPFLMGTFRYYLNESNPGRLLNTCENISATDASIRFSVEANKWIFFTPMFDINVADITVTNDASFVFRYYDAQNRAANGASGSWKNVDSDKLLAGQGYIFHCNKACEIVMPADAEAQKMLFRTTDASRTLTVNESESTANRSWNYVGNPYPCYYDIYYMDFTAPITVWNGSTYKAYSIADDDLVLRPMQSFFVQKPDAVDKITFKKEGRQLTTSIAHGAAARAAAPARSNRYLFNLQIARNDNEQTATDETRVVLNDEARMGYEVERDAAKFFSFDAAVPQLFTTDGEDNSYAINERPAANGVVTLGYSAGAAGYYTIKATRTDGVAKLLDRETGTTVNLTPEGYTFHSDATNGVNKTRFQLMLGLVNETTGINETTADGQQTGDAVYDLQGRKVVSAKKGLYIKNGKIEAVKN